MVGSLAPSYARLASQKQLCGRLAYLTRFSSLLAFVAGCEGAGKTTIIQQYLELQPDTNQALITCNNNGEAESVRQQIISQLFPATTFNAQASLNESLLEGQCLEADSQNLLIVIDDAHFLPEGVLNELWQLQLENRASGYPNQINVLLFALPQWCSQSHKLLNAQADEPPIELDIPALDTSDAIAMAKYHLALAGLSNNISSDLQAIIKAGHLSPGAIFSKLFPEQSPKNSGKKPLFILALKDKFSKLNLKALAVSLAVILVVVINGVYQLQTAKDDPALLELNSAVDTKIQTNEQNKEVTLNNSEPSTLQANTEDASEVTSEQLVATWPNDTENPSDKNNTQVLPKLITSANIEISSNPINGKQIVVSGEQVDRLVEQGSKNQQTLIDVKSPTNFKNGKVRKVTSLEASVKLEILTWEAQSYASEQTQEPAPHAAETNKDSVKSNSKNNPKKNIPEKNTAKSKPNNKSKPKVSQRKEPKNNKAQAQETKVKPLQNNDLEVLKSKANTHYTLQLSGFSSRQQVTNFIAGNQLQDTAWTYQTIRNDKPWFVVIMGDYATLADSRAAISALPLSLRSVSPWGKSFASVKKEIKLFTKGKI